MVLPNCALIHEAFVHVKKKRKGVSLFQIGKHLEATYEERLDAKKKKFIFRTFKSLVQEGKLLQKGVVYKSTKQQAIVRANIPKRHYRRYSSRHKRLSRRRHDRHRRHYHGRRHHARNRHHRRRGNHKIHIRRVHHRKFRGRRCMNELLEPPNYTNSVPSVEVPDNKPPRSTSRSSNKRN